MNYNEQSLMRATQGDSMLNYPVIVAGFLSKGITDIKPRINILTLRAWNAKGRQVKKGETGVKCVTWIDCEDKEGNKYKKIKSVTVFHISQTVIKNS